MQIMKRSTINTHQKTFLDHEDFFLLLEDFINDSYYGVRLTKKGKRLNHNSIENYRYMALTLVEFTKRRRFRMRIYLFDNLTPSQREDAAKWYLRFYRKYTSFLYEDKGYFDNYVGSLIKHIRSFFHYLEKERDISIGNYLRYFHVLSEDIQIVALRPDQLQYVIHSHEFSGKLDDALSMVRDVFIFGCTVGLRFSDLMALSTKNLIVKNNNYYVSIRNKKTAVKTSIKLPPYAIDVVERYKNKYPTLMPPFSLQIFNQKLKKMAKFLPEDYVLPKIRERRGIPVVIYKDKAKKQHYHISDHMSSHVMRRTAITVMMILGVPEHIVRQISGHAPNSKSFFRYVEVAQDYFDYETDRAFDKLCSYNPYNPKHLMENPRKD